MKITLIDYNDGLIDTPIQVMGVCRQKECTVESLQKCLNEKPHPHLSVLEFNWFCFKLEDIPIRVIRQLERHRQFSFMEKSSRHNYMNKIHEGLPGNLYSEIENLQACQGDLDYEDASWAVTMANTTDMYIAGNGRVFYEYLQKRLCHKHVLPIHYQFAFKLFAELKRVLPEVFNFNMLTCNSCNKCKEG